MAQFVCYTCGSNSVMQSDLGQYICADCGTQSQEMMEEAAEDGMLNKPNAFARTIDSHVERHETQDAEEAVLTAMEASAGAPAISDDPVAATAIAYVQGMQLVLQGVLEALVAKFGCSQEVMGVAGEMWHALVQQSEVLCDGLEREAGPYVPQPTGEEVVMGLDDIDLAIDEDGLADATAADPDPEPESEPQPKKRRKRKARKILKRATKKKPGMGLGGPQQAQRIFGVLSRRLPTDLPLSVAFLACFWLREPVLPTDIVRWTLEGHIPYLAPSLSLPPQIEQRLRGLAVHPLSIPSPRTIEFRAAIIAEHLSLELPPINAHLVAARLLQDLGLPDSLAAPVDRLLNLVTPQGFWIASNKRAVPPRTFVAAIILIAVKLLHHLGGPITSKTKGKQHQLTPPPDVLRNLTPPSRGLQMPSPAPPLITRPGEPVDLQNLDHYLRYLKEVIFKGAEPAADLKDYHAACEKLFQGAVSAEAARPCCPPARDADVAGPQKADCDVGVLTPMLDTEEPLKYELIHYIGNVVSSSGHRDYIRLLRSLAAAIWVTPKGLHKIVKEVELDLIDLERSMQENLSERDTWQAGT